MGVETGIFKIAANLRNGSVLLLTFITVAGQHDSSDAYSIGMLATRSGRKVMLCTPIMRSSTLIVAILAAFVLTTVCQSFFGGFGVAASSAFLSDSVPAGGPVGSLSFDPNAYYRLTTMWQGECKSLDIIADRTNHQLILAKTSDVSGQYWRITSASGGYSRLTNRWQGVTKSLDVANDGTNNRPILGATGNHSGQYWRITPTGGGYFRITNLWRGDSKSLDIINDGRENNRPILSPTGNVFGQYWKISVAKFVTTPPASLGLNSFYKKYLDADGIPVISSDRVPNIALHQVRFMALHMLSKKPDVLAQMVRHGARIAVMARTEVTTDIPEHSHLRRDTSENWDTRARGLGGIVSVPTGSCAEENVLCYGEGNTCNNYRCEDIFIHEFTHSIHNLGLVFAYPGFQSELDAAYRNAIRGRLWLNTYAIKNSQEYFAEGVQDWFNVNNPPNDQHNHVNTREELRAYDITLYNLLQKYFPEDVNKCSCH